jgi:hypothetical protein
MGDVSSPDFSYVSTQTLIPASLAYAILLLTEFTECQTGEASWRK